MFSNSTKYAIRTIEYLLFNKEGGKNTVGALAKELDIPQPYLSKIMQQLSKSKLISSTKGRGGGFYLSEENMKRPLIDIVICIEGKNVFRECVLGLPECSDDNPCMLHEHFKKFRDSLRQSVCKDGIKFLLSTSQSQKP
ncbi:MAG: Rrf2 family transcriptional regulator [Cyclobacteriaceae bacterium]|nr:Rrf2 family transcriptional regulator [Cyclobacteriaceae bacterium]